MMKKGFISPLRLEIENGNEMKEMAKTKKKVKHGAGMILWATLACQSCRHKMVVIGCRIT